MLNQQTRILINLSAVFFVIGLLILFLKSRDNMADLKQHVANIPGQVILNSKNDEITHLQLPAALYYSAAKLPSPFGNTSELMTGISTTEPNEGNPLLGYSINTLKFVGTMVQAGGTFAFIQTPDGLFYQVSMGDRIGNSDGRIVLITEDKVEIAEQTHDKNKMDTTRIISLQLKDK